MTNFEDGPAAGVTLAIKRSPELLRVVFKPAKLGRLKEPAWDALDAPTDMPSIDETIYVYRLVKLDGHMHIRAQKFSGFFPVATYKLCEVQPDDETARGIRSWFAWQKEHCK